MWSVNSQKKIIKIVDPDVTFQKSKMQQIACRLGELTAKFSPEKTKFGRKIGKKLADFGALPPNNLGPDRQQTLRIVYADPGWLLR